MLIATPCHKDDKAPEPVEWLQPVEGGTNDNRLPALSEKSWPRLDLLGRLFRFFQARLHSSPVNFS
jgi:hypothetical protein